MTERRQNSMVGWDLEWYEDEICGGSGG